MASDFGNVIGTLEPLRDNARGSIQVRVIEKRDGRFVDLRTFFVGDDGRSMIPTKKGVFLSEEEWDELLRQAPKISDLVEKGARQRRAEAPARTRNGKR